MTDQSVTDRAQRGRTVIDDRVRQRLVEHAVLAVPGTTRHRGLTAKTLPAVRFDDRAPGNVEVQVAAQWPLNASGLVASVRGAIDDELGRSLGESAGSVQVHVARVDGAPANGASPVALAAIGDGAETSETVGAPVAPASAASAPRKVAGASLTAVVVLLATLALGVIALRDTAVSFGWAAGSRWIDAVPAIADDVRWTWWTWPAAVVAVLAGAVLLITAVKPRRKSHVQVSDEVWLHKNVAHDRKKELS